MSKNKKRPPYLPAPRSKPLPLRPSRIGFLASVGLGLYRMSLRFGMNLKTLRKALMTDAELRAAYDRGCAVGNYRNELAPRRPSGASRKRKGKKASKKASHSLNRSQMRREGAGNAAP